MPASGPSQRWWQQSAHRDRWPRSNAGRWLKEVHQVMGLPGLLIGILLLASTLAVIGILVAIGRSMRSDRELFVGQVLEQWADTTRDYSGRTLHDWVHRYLQAGTAEERAKVQQLVSSLGQDMEQVHQKFPWVRIAAIAIYDRRLQSDAHQPIAQWQNPYAELGTVSARIPLGRQQDRALAEMEVNYRVHDELRVLLSRLQYYSRLTVGLIVILAVVMVLCFAGLVWQFLRLRQRAQAEAEELRRADRLKLLGMLTYGLAHNLNNALAPIASVCQAAALKLERDSPLQEGLQIVERNVARAADIVERLRHLSQAGQRRFVPVDLNAILDESLESVRKDLEQAAIQVHRRLQPLPPIEGNPVDLWQLFTNLLVNAREAIQKVRARPGSIRVVTYPKDGTVVAEVADNGIGMTEEVRARIGQPWFSTKNDNQASGIGLWVCTRILQEHGGSWEIDSTPGEGTVLRLWLPCSRRSDFQEGRLS